ncbi:hypothetical protein HKD37_08G023977 [Glycine soja]
MPNEISYSSNQSRTENKSQENHTQSRNRERCKPHQKQLRSVTQAPRWHKLSHVAQPKHR